MHDIQILEQLTHVFKSPSALLCSLKVKQGILKCTIQAGLFRSADFMLAQGIDVNEPFEPNYNEAETQAILSIFRACGFKDPYIPCYSYRKNKYPLTQALEHKHYILAKHLINKGANPNLTRTLTLWNIDSSFNLAISYSGYYCKSDPRALQLLLNAGASADHIELCGMTALHVAARDHNLDCARILVEHSPHLLFLKCWEKWEKNVGFVYQTPRDLVNAERYPELAAYLDNAMAAHLNQNEECKHTFSMGC